MISTEEFSKIFSDRHSFDGEDVQILKNKFPNIQFNNIPDAWILGIDRLLRKTRYAGIVSIAQRNGFLFISARNDILSEYIEEVEQEIYSLDADLHKLLEK